HKIVVPLDLTAKHQKALETAAELAAAGGEVALVHVVELIPGLPVEEEKAFYNRLERVARAHLERADAVMRERKILPARKSSSAAGPWRSFALPGTSAPTSSF